VTGLSLGQFPMSDELDGKSVRERIEDCRARAAELTALINDASPAAAKELETLVRQWLTLAKRLEDQLGGALQG
jgi:hypothetical protein